MADITSDVEFNTALSGNGELKLVLAQVPSTASASDTFDLESDDAAPVLDNPRFISAVDTDGDSTGVALDQSTGVVTLDSAGEQEVLIVGV